MAGKNEIKNRIVLEGESEYKKQLAGINRELKESKAAMRAAAAEYDAAGGSMAAAYQQGDALERMYRQQGDALELMNGQLAKVESAYGKNSREATELRTKINNMRAEMAKTQTEMRQFEQRLEDGAQAMEEAGSASNEAVQGFESIGQSAQDARGGVSDLIGDLAQLAGAKIGVDVVLNAAGAAVAAGQQQTQSEGQLAAYTGAVGAELEQLQAIAENVYKSGFGDSLVEAARNVGVMTTYTGAMGEELENATEIAMRLDDVFGMDVPESARTANQLMTVFGLNAQEAYALIAAGAQEGADKNGNLLDTLNEYAPYYEKAGKSAEEFMGTLTAGAQNGIYDIDKIGDAMKEFTLRIGDGSETTQEALKALGIEAADLPGKFAMGGETASAAFDLVIQSIAAIEDPLTRQNAAIALFGTQWEDTGGALLTIFSSIASGATDAEGALESLDVERINDLGVQWDGLARRVELSAGNIMEPLVETTAEALHELNENIDEAGGSVVTGLIDTVDQANDQMAMRAARAFDSWWREVFGGGEQEEEAAAAGTELAQSAADAISSAAAEADTAGADVAQAAVDAISGAAPDADAAGTDVAQAAADAISGQTPYAAAAGAAFSQASVDAVIGQTPYAAAAGADIARAAVEAIIGEEDSAAAAGDMIGEEAVDGAESGLGGMRSAGKAGADDLVSGLSTGRDRAYQQGYAAGQAYWRGYSNAMAGGGSSTAYTRAQALRAAVAEDFAMGFAPAPQAALRASAGAIDYEEMGRAVAQAVSGMTLGMDARKAGGMLEIYVAQAGSERTAGTARGAGAKTRRW